MSGVDQKRNGDCGPGEAGAFAALKARMEAHASAYGRQLPATDMSHLILGLNGVLSAVPKVSFTPLGERDGAYDPEHHVILIDSEAGPQRQRFTLAHEISHALLLNDDDLLSDLHDLYEGDRLEQAIETLCNVGAAALLMPATLVGSVLEKFGPTAKALYELAKRADVSAEAALYTLAEQTRTAVMYAVCAPRTRQSITTVRASAASATFPYTLGPGTLIPDTHPAARALVSGLPAEEESFIPFRSGRRMPAFVTAYPAGRQVLVAFALGQKMLDRIGKRDAAATVSGAHADRYAVGDEQSRDPGPSSAAE